MGGSALAQRGLARVGRACCPRRGEQPPGYSRHIPQDVLPIDSRASATADSRSPLRGADPEEGRFVRPKVVAVSALMVAGVLHLGSATPAAAGTARRVWAWGSNSRGELGDGTTTERNKPVRVHFPAGVAISAVSAGYLHSMALDTQGRVWEWGSLDDAQHLVPVRTTAWPGRTPTIVSVSAGVEYDLALSAGGKVYAWGVNDGGDLGNGTTDSSASPVRVHFPRSVDVGSISGGPYDGYAIDAAGSAWAWGQGGAIGNGSFSNETVPVRISMPQGITFATIARASV